jgi:hypothetical protein
MSKKKTHVSKQRAQRLIQERLSGCLHNKTSALSTNRRRDHQ